MLEKIAKNIINQDSYPIFNTPADVKEKLDYYRSLFNKTHDLTEQQFEELKRNISTFFNIKPTRLLKTLPTRLVRISNNNRICATEKKELGYLTNISQLLAPPITFTNYGRCNINEQQVVYCSINEASAYWEAKPQNGDVITISHFELKPNVYYNCASILKEKNQNPKIEHWVQEVYYMVEDFFVDVFSLDVSRDRPKDYVFSAMLSSDQIFYPITSEKNIEAIMYPSVQKKKFGQNVAIRQDVLFEKYNLLGVETRFILKEYEDVSPETDDLTTDNLISSFGTKTFNFNTGEILHKENVNEIFKLFREMQLHGENQVRIDNPMNKKNFAFDLSSESGSVMEKRKTKLYPNDRVIVVYQNGNKKHNVKYKTIKEDIEKGLCRITKY